METLVSLGGCVKLKSIRGFMGTLVSLEDVLS
jgi:hypothetical protein